MRAVVIAVKNNIAAVAFKNGCMQYVEDAGYEAGQILDLPLNNAVSFEKPRKKKLSFPIRHFGSSFAAAAAVLIFAGTVSAYAMPLSFVTIDVNPSLSMGVNVFNRVIEADPGNEDGADILKDISGEIIGKKLPDAVDIVFTEFKDKEYVAEMNTPVEGTVRGLISDRRNEKLINELNHCAERWNNMQSGCSVSFEAVSVTKELAREADKKGMPPGRMMLERRQKEIDEKKVVPMTNADSINDTPNTPEPSDNDNAITQNPAESAPSDIYPDNTQGKSDEKNPALSEPEPEDKNDDRKDNDSPSEKGGNEKPAPEMTPETITPVPDNDGADINPAPTPGDGSINPAPDSGNPNPAPPHAPENMSEPASPPDNTVNNGGTPPDDEHGDDHGENHDDEDHRDGNDEGHGGGHGGGHGSGPGGPR